MGNVHIEVLHGMELNDLLRCGTEGKCVNGRMDTGLEIAGTGQRSVNGGNGQECLELVTTTRLIHVVQRPQMVSVVGEGNVHL